MELNDLSHLTDLELVQALQSAESEEDREIPFVEIYGRYMRKVELWATVACREGLLSESDIDDVINTVFFEKLAPEEVLLFRVVSSEHPIDFDVPEASRDDLRHLFEENQTSLSERFNVVRTTNDTLLITDEEKGKRYVVRRKGAQLTIYEQRGLLVFKGRCSLKTYIRTVTRSYIIDVCRKRRRGSLDAVVETQGKPDTLQEERTDYRTWLPVSPTPEQTAIRRQIREILKAALDLLAQGQGRDSWKDASIIWMYYRKGMTDREMGEELNLKENTVTVRRHRALKQLREILRRRFGINSPDELL